MLELPLISLLHFKAIHESQKPIIAKVQAYAVVKMLRCGKLDYKYTVVIDVARRVTNIRRTETFWSREMKNRNSVRYAYVALV